MKRLRQVKRYGNSYFIALSKIDMKDFELKVGDEVDITEVVKIDKKKTKVKNGKTNM